MLHQDSRTLLANFRAAFPALRNDLIYLDSAATALKPQSLIDATADFYASAGTVFRSQYKDAQSLTERYEATRQLVAKWLNAASEQQIIWTKGATESANLIANSYFKHRLSEGDEIIVSEMEHHANLIPWIMLAKSTGAKIIPLPLNASNIPSLDDFKRLISDKTKLLAITQMSNLTGAQPAIAQFIKIAHEYDCKVIVDGAQGITHLNTDVQEIDPDFYFFSAHKLYGPTGVGVLYVSDRVLDDMLPWQGGGKMLSHAKMDDFIPEDPPYCFEAGTPNMAGIIGLNATLSWLQQWPLQILENHAIGLAHHAHQLLSSCTGYQRISVDGSSILTFTLKGIHANDLDMLLSEQNIAIRSGLHCAHPFNRALGIHGSIRASFAPFNTLDEVERFVSAVRKSIELLE